MRPSCHRWPTKPPRLRRLPGGGAGAWAACQRGEPGNNVEGREIQRYTEAAHAALLGQEPVSEGKARRLRPKFDELEAFRQIVQAAAARRARASSLRSNRPPTRPSGLSLEVVADIRLCLAGWWRRPRRLQSVLTGRSS